MGNEQKNQSNARVAWNEFIGKFGGTTATTAAPESSTSTPTPVESAPAPVAEPVLSENVEVAPVSTNTTSNDDSKIKKMLATTESSTSATRMSIIAENMVVTGNCEVEGDIEIYGSVTGDVTAGGNVGLYGKIIGNVKAANVMLYAAEVSGSIETPGTIEMDRHSTVSNGKIIAAKLISNGTTLCDMEISEVVRFQSASNASGSIKTARISIEEGAVFAGSVTVG